MRARNYSNPLYNTWRDMRRRCQDPNRPDYKWYGAKGITVCDEWEDFDKFVDDMGPTWFEGGTIERKDRAKGYDKNNCAWLTIEEQQKNRSNVHGHWLKRGEIVALRQSGMTFQAIADLLGMSQGQASKIYAGRTR